MTRDSFVNQICDFEHTNSIGKRLYIPSDYVYSEYIWISSSSSCPFSLEGNRALRSLSPLKLLGLSHNYRLLPNLGTQVHLVLSLSFFAMSLSAYPSYVFLLGSMLRLSSCSHLHFSSAHVQSVSSVYLNIFKCFSLIIARWPILSRQLTVVLARLLFWYVRSDC